MYFRTYSTCLNYGCSLGTDPPCGRFVLDAPNRYRTSPIFSGDGYCSLGVRNVDMSLYKHLSTLELKLRRVVYWTFYSISFVAAMDYLACILIRVHITWTEFYPRTGCDSTTNACISDG